MSDEAGPLIELVRKLRLAGVPSLNILESRLSGWEGYLRFVELVREFLPEREQDILSKSTPMKQMAAFASYFEERYFPIQNEFKWEEDLDYEDLTTHIPIILLGIGYEDYEYVSSDWEPGAQLMTFLVRDPYDTEVHIALAEACLRYVPKELLEQAPEGGLEPGELHKLLDKTQYESLALWADIIWKVTDNFFWDYDYETMRCDLEYPDWDRETVETLTQQWLQAEVIEQKVYDLARWLEEDPPARFGELLKFISQRRKGGEKGES